MFDFLPLIKNGGARNGPTLAFLLLHELKDVTAMRSVLIMRGNRKQTTEGSCPQQNLTSPVVANVPCNLEVPAC